MTKTLCEIHRTATLAWSPAQQSPLVATGTVSGALDDSFSNASELELFQLDLGRAKTDHQGLAPVGKVSTNARFNTLGWGNPSADKALGIIAGGMDSGELELWNPEAILKGADDALILRNATHSGPIRSIDFNRLQPNLLASAGSNSEVFIWDLTNPSKPYSPGARSAKLDDITNVAWNCRVQHILATSSVTGYTVVWDLKNRKEIMTLTGQGAGGLGNGRGISAIAWHPDVPTQIVTASEDDNNPVITLWDLRHAHAPEKVLTGHQKGVLDLSWCRQDPDLLVSCGKDCRTLCWNPRTGDLLGELPQSTNWTFEVGWCPQNPDLLATASFDGKVNMYSIQGAGNEEPVVPATTPAVADDPFAAALLATTAPPQAGFALKHPPKWLRRPVGASFGFGGKLVSFNNKAGEAALRTVSGMPPSSAPATQHVPRNVTITTVVTEPAILQRSDELETALDQQTLEELTKKRRDQAESHANLDDKEAWDMLHTLFAEEPRKQLTQYLGVSKEDLASAVARLTGTQTTSTEIASPDTPVAETTVEDKVAQDAKDTEKDAATETSPTVTATTETLHGLFQASDVQSPDLDFFSKQPDAEEETWASTTTTAVPTEKVTLVTQTPLQLYAKDSSEHDQLITRSIVLGDFASAVELCLADDRLADALMLALCRGGDLLESTKKAYFERQAQKTAYLRLLQSIVDGDLSAIVQHASLDEWTSIVAVLCTFAKGDEFAVACGSLGDRLEEAWLTAAKQGDSEKGAEYRRHATLCYLAAANVEKVSKIWIAEQEEQQAAGESESQSLQTLVEKMTVFRKAIDYHDDLLDNQSPTHVFPLGPLYDKYAEYAEWMASQGRLDVALRYLNLVPKPYRSTSTDRFAVIRDRIYCASSQAPIEPLSIGSTPIQAQEQTYVPSAAPGVADPTPANVYAPTAAARAAPQQPTNARAQATYMPQPFVPAPTAYAAQPTYAQPTYAPTANMYTGAPGYGYAPTQAAHVPQPSFTPPPPPPHAGSPSGSAGASPSVAKATAWNDPPIVADPNVNKKPAAAPAAPRRVTSPFPNAPAPSAFAPPRQQQQSPLPPPQQQQQHNPQQYAYQPQQQPMPTVAQPPAAAPLPPPPRNAAAPTPLRQHNNQPGYQPPGRRSPATPPPPQAGAPMAGPPRAGMPPQRQPQMQPPPPAAAGMGHNAPGPGHNYGPPPSRMTGVPPPPRR